MRWPWTGRQEAAEKKARQAEAELRKAKADHDIARLVAEASRQSRHQNGFAEMIRLAMGVSGEHGNR